MFKVHLEILRPSRLLRLRSLSRNLTLSPKTNHVTQTRQRSYVHMYTYPCYSHAVKPRNARRLYVRMTSGLCVCETRSKRSVIWSAWLFESDDLSSTMVKPGKRFTWRGSRGHPHIKRISRNCRALGFTTRMSRMSWFRVNEPQDPSERAALRGSANEDESRESTRGFAIAWEIDRWNFASFTGDPLPWMT